MSNVWRRWRAVNGESGRPPSTGWLPADPGLAAVLARLATHLWFRAHTISADVAQRVRVVGANAGGGRWKVALTRLVISACDAFLACALLPNARTVIVADQPAV